MKSTPDPGKKQTQSKQKRTVGNKLVLFVYFLLYAAFPFLVSIMRLGELGFFDGRLVILFGFISMFVFAPVYLNFPYNNSDAAKEFLPFIISLGMLVFAGMREEDIKHAITLQSAGIVSAGLLALTYLSIKFHDPILFFSNATKAVKRGKWKMVWFTGLFFLIIFSDGFIQSKTVIGKIAFSAVVLSSAYVLAKEHILILKKKRSLS